jgi:glyoxylase-like metal-dependent hydrolase (beta-lactamase superfamily II)
VRILLGLALTALLGGCTHQLQSVQHPPSALAVTTRVPNVSMMYLARVDGGVIAIDLGWVGAASSLERALAGMRARPSDVLAVFLTHGHRDHIGAWRQLRHVPFYMAEPEADRFVGRAPHAGWIPRLAERIRPADRPAQGEVEIRAFSHDTVFAFGSDTLRVFLVPGHTAGSTAYLFRGVLFVGDALARLPLVGFRATPSGFADDPARASASLETLWDRVSPFRVEYVCTAHAKCAAYTEAFRRKVSRTQPPPA